jgi:enoyl-[acyl-carrier protein] reductase I
MDLTDRKLLITGVLTDDSIAFAVAKAAQEAGAEIVLTSFGRPMRLTQRVARRLPAEPDVLELDVTEPAHIEAVAADLQARWGHLDGLLHAIAFAPEDALAGNFLHTPPESAELAFRISAYSMKSVAVGLLDLLKAAPDGGSVVGLDFDATRAWPVYDWMGVAKAALESVNRYLARDLGPHGVRSNLIAAGPLRTIAAKGIGGFDQIAGRWSEQSPLAWDLDDAGPVADTALFLLSRMSRGITGEIINVDGGYHALGAPKSPPAMS